VIRQLLKLPSCSIVLAGCIGPFSLAARLLDVTEALQLTVTDPALVQTVLEKSSRFLIAYLCRLKAAGAAGVVMAEPTAGLLSPAALGEFSSAWVRQIIQSVQDDRFTVVLHNCGARPVHLASVLASRAIVFHFGAPMDLATALCAAGERVICGNLDPSSVFARSSSDEVSAKTRELLSRHAQHENFVPSSGCDLPPGVPLENLDAFFEAVRCRTKA
jgi:uroporphyrinogen decarboxylase